VTGGAATNYVNYADQMREAAGAPLLTCQTLFMWGQCQSEEYADFVLEQTELASFSDMAHGFLEGASYLPFGEWYGDAPNGLLYALEGRPEEGAPYVAFAAAGPVAGKVAKGLRFADEFSDLLNRLLGSKIAKAGNKWQDDGLAAFGLTKNNKNISTIEGLPGIRPDSTSGGILWEFKSGQRVYKDQQMRGYQIVSDREHMAINLVVAPNTHVSGPVYLMIQRSGGQIYVFNAAAGTYATYIR
jgi:hypothetical protein